MTPLPVEHLQPGQSSVSSIHRDAHCATPEFNKLLPCKRLKPAGDKLLQHLRPPLTTVATLATNSYNTLQLGRSSPAIHGGAYFSAVCGWKYIRISSPRPYKHRECYRLLFFPPGATFFLPYTAFAAQWAFQMDLWWSRSHGFVSLTRLGQLYLRSIFGYFFLFFVCF